MEIGNTNDSSREWSDTDLKRGYWLTVHRGDIQRSWLVALSVAVALIVLYALYLGVFAIIGIMQHSSYVQSLNTPIVQPGTRRIPQALAVVRTNVVRSDAGSVDVLVDLKNTNDTWAASAVDYELIVGGGTVATSTVSLAPGQEQLFVSKRIAYAQGDLPQIRVTIKKVIWNKIDPNTLPDVQFEFGTPKIEIIRTGAAAKVNTVSTPTTPLSSAVGVETQLQLSVKNKSVFGFREPTVVVLLSDAQKQVVGMSSITLDAFRSSEDRQLTFRFPGNLTSGVTPTVFMNLDLLNERHIIRSLSQ